MSMPTCPSCIYAQGICEKTGVKIRYSTGCTYHNPKPMTNADRIRSMSDEELAEYMGDVQTWGGCPNHGARNCTENCADCWLDWLKQEVTTNSTT